MFTNSLIVNTSHAFSLVDANLTEIDIATRFDGVTVNQSTLSRLSCDFSLIAAQILDPHSANERQQNWLQLNILTEEKDG